MVGQREISRKEKQWFDSWGIFNMTGSTLTKKEMLSDMVLTKESPQQMELKIFRYVRWKHNVHYIKFPCWKSVAIIDDVYDIGRKKYESYHESYHIKHSSVLGYLIKLTF